MSSFNKITIVGYLGRDPELRYLPSGGQAVCNFSVATTEKRKNRDTDEQEDHTTWFRITAWGRLAELCNEYLRKGSQAYIEGRLRMEEFTDREGSKRSSLVVNASDIQFLGKKGENGGGERDDAPSPEDKQARREALKTPQAVAEEVEQDDEIPF